MRNTSQIATTLPNGQKQALEQWCEENERSMGWVVRKMVQEGMIKRGIIKEKK